MAGPRTSGTKLLLALAVVPVLVAAFAATPLALAAAGNDGTVKIHEGSAEPSPVTKNEPHVCTFHVHALFFDAGQTLTFVIKSWPPTGDRPVVLTGTIQTDSDGAGRSPETGAFSLADGHYKLFVDTGDASSGRDKQKVFWVQCGEATTTTGATTTTTGVTSSSGETSTSGKETTTSGASSSSAGGASSSAPSSSLGGTGAGSSKSRLPFTGSNALPVLIAGLLLFGTGAAAVRAARNHR